MNNQTFNVSIQFILDALQLRYDNVKELWGGDAAHELWEQALAMVEDCGIGDNVTSPSIFVDSYLINGEFVSKEDDKKEVHCCVPPRVALECLKELFPESAFILISRKEHLNCSRK